MQKSVFFLTRSTSVKALYGNYSTSSQAYEVSLISSLAEQIDVIVIYIGSNPATAESDENGNPVTLRNGRHITYLSFGKISFSKIFKVVDLIKNFAENRDTAILTTGYHPNEMIALLLARSSTTKSYSIVFDTHAQGNSRMPPIKRWAANAYFEFGYKLLDFLSGVIVLNDLFVKSEKKKFRYLKSKIGGVCSQHNLLERPAPPPIKILFAGTLNAENGVKLILEFLELNPDLNLEVTVVGYGELQDLIVVTAQQDHRIKFLGTLTDEALDVKMAASDLLICLRDPHSSVCQHAFPSKLIKFMSSGIPVISNEFPGLDEDYHSHLLLIKAFSASALHDLLENLKGVNYRDVGNSAKGYIQSHHRWSDISQEMLRFMFPYSLTDQHQKLP